MTTSTKEELVSWYDQMLVIRGTEKAAYDLFMTGLVKGTTGISSPMRCRRWYMTGGQVSVPMVVRTANGGGLGFGAQHSRAVKNWALTVPGLIVVAPSTPSDVIGLMASSVRSDDPVIFFEHKALFATKGEPAPAGHVVPLGKANVCREGTRHHSGGLGLVHADYLGGRRRRF